MYKIGTATGALLVAHGGAQLPGPAQGVATGMLPYTGIACGLWLAAAVVLIILGMILRSIGTVDA